MRTLTELMDLSGRTAIVTGGAMGIGLGIARRLAEAGARVVLADVDAVAAETAAKELHEAGHEALGIGADVANEQDVRDAIARTVAAFGSVDLLVNNAGVYPNITLADLEPDEFDRVIGVNLRGVYLCTKYAAERMREQGRGGCVVNITSIDALHPSMIGLAAYDASKHGVWGFTKNTAVELAKDGIRVNAVAPGGIATPGTAVGGAVSEDLIAAFEARIPMGRMGDPDEIGAVVAFLASDMASYMTGSQVVVDGGALLK